MDIANLNCLRRRVSSGKQVQGPYAPTTNGGSTLTLREALAKYTRGPLGMGLIRYTAMVGFYRSVQKWRYCFPFFP
jgi:hypothetical protein